ncbi:hypothetical protein GOODEAATRI_011860 [Goodea atripinnis]|uniref:Uncharacterized protein n=1 Tax=Goodea atripinnis TaxID=208336 RepID=A0ABV0NJI0_9TELE
MIHWTSTLNNTLNQQQSLCEMTAGAKQMMYIHYIKHFAKSSEDSFSYWKKTQLVRPADQTQTVLQHLFSKNMQACLQVACLCPSYYAKVSPNYRPKLHIFYSRNQRLN